MKKNNGTRFMVTSLLVFAGLMSFDPPSSAEPPQEVTVTGHLPSNDTGGVPGTVQNWTQVPGATGYQPQSHEIDRQIPAGTGMPAPQPTNCGGGADSVPSAQQASAGPVIYSSGK